MRNCTRKLAFWDFRVLVYQDSIIFYVYLFDYFLYLQYQQDRNAELRYCIERFHVLALGRIEEESEPNSFQHVSAEFLARSPLRTIRYVDDTSDGGDRDDSGSAEGVLRAAGVISAGGVGNGSASGEKDVRDPQGPMPILDGNCNKQCVLSDVHLDARKTATLYR